VLSPHPSAHTDTIAQPISKRVLMASPSVFIVIVAVAFPCTGRPRPCDCVTAARPARRGLAEPTNQTAPWGPRVMVATDPPRGANKAVVSSTGRG
jgi:hypothetical protein